MNWCSFYFFIGIRILSLKAVTDALKAKGLGFKQDYVDIYSNSWGPNGDGFDVPEAGVMTEEVLRQGTFKVKQCLYLYFNIIFCDVFLEF